MRSMLKDSTPEKTGYLPLEELVDRAIANLLFAENSEMARNVTLAVLAFAKNYQLFALRHTSALVDDLDEVLSFGRFNSRHFFEAKEKLEYALKETGLKTPAEALLIADQYCIRVTGAIPSLTNLYHLQFELGQVRSIGPQGVTRLTRSPICRARRGLTSCFEKTDTRISGVARISADAREFLLLPIASN